jgi:hypothetical protein
VPLVHRGHRLLQQDPAGLFSPDSISLRTTVISVSRSARAMKLLIIASACQPRYQRRFSSLAEKVAK